MNYYIIIFASILAFVLYNKYDTEKFENTKDKLIENINKKIFDYNLNIINRGSR